MTRITPRSLVWPLIALAGLGCSAVFPTGLSQAGAPVSAMAGAPSFKGDVARILKQHCASCHSTGGMAARSIELFDADGNAQYSVAKARVADIVGSIRSGRMPLGMPNSVPAADLKLLEDWQKAGSPELPTTVQNNNDAAVDLSAALNMPPVSPVTISGTDFGFAPQRIQVPAGRRVPIVFENKGVVDHDWVVPALVRQVKARAGRSTTEEVVFEKPGEYDIICSLPFHSEFGMKGKLVVVADPNAPVMALEVPSTGVPLPAGVKRLPQPVMAPPVNRSAPTTVAVEIEATEEQALIADGVATTLWTFGGTVPGPMVRVRQGDTVKMTLKNSIKSKETHSIDFHAATGPGGGGKHSQIPPGGKAEITFKALNPGVYVYHCATPKVGAHISNGMYGMMVVEPPEGLPKVDREFYLMQGELYLKGERGTTGLREFSWEKLLQEQPEYVVMNGSAGAVTGENAFKAKVGETVRIFFGVGGPNIVSSFHMIGEIFDRIYPEGASEIQHNVQTTLVPAGGATIVEAKLDTPGVFPLVDHSLGRLDKGCAALLMVDGAEQPDIFKPGARVDSEGKDLAHSAGSGGH